jgi:hypothetical protein
MANASPHARPWQRSLGDQRLLVSGFGNRGGGLYDLTSAVAVTLDDIPTSGIGLGDGRLWRTLRAPGEQTAACELLSYDDRGLRSYRRIDGVRDPHDVCWHDGAAHISSSWDGTIWRVDDDGSVGVAWSGGPVPDSWHINSLVVVDGRMHVCAFGRFDRHKAWRSGDGSASGFVLDTTSGRDVLAGLAHPHSPRWVNTRWYVCESTKGTLTECDSGGRILRRARIGRFTRGLAVVDRWAFVGGNAHRRAPDDRAEVAVVDLATFEVTERIGLPCSELYDIIAAPADLARGVAVGFGVNTARAVAQHRNADRRGAGRHFGWQFGRHRLVPPRSAARVQLVGQRVATQLAAAGRRLDHGAAAACAVSGTPPTEMRAGDVLTLDLTVENRSAIPLSTVPPHPIRIGARWFPADGHSDGPVARNPLVALPQLVHPGLCAPAEAILEAPDVPGRYELWVTLHQAGRGWFGRRIEAPVTVRAARSTDQHHDGTERSPAPRWTADRDPATAPAAT